MRRLECGAGRRAALEIRRPTFGSRRPAIPGLGLVRRPRVWFAATHSGDGGAPPGGTMASCQELADGGRFGPSGCGGRFSPEREKPALDLRASRRRSRKRGPPS
jgi:hypothetical protein